jgi:hypothetical protein
MSLTSNCDALAQLNESAFNNIIREIMLQRPSLFNYATKSLIASGTFCVPIAVNPVLANMNVAKATEVDPLPVIGAPAGTPGVNFCIQIRELRIDFHPGNAITLPPELGVLGSQEVALKGTVCAGIACNERIRLRDVEMVSTLRLELSRGLRFWDFPKNNLQSFCLSFYAKVRIVQDNGFLLIKVTGLEIQDLAPLGLENAIECYLKQVLDLSVLPKMKIALSDLVFDAKSYFTVALQPVTAAIPVNPDVTNDNLSVFIDLN